MWFLGWPIFGCLFLAGSLGVRGVLVEEEGEGGRGARFVQLTYFAGDLADNIAAALSEHLKIGDGGMSIAASSSESAQLASGQSVSTWRPTTVCGTVFWPSLWINGIVTGVMVQNCMAAGCCLDDPATYINCTTTGRPN